MTPQRRDQTVFSDSAQPTTASQHGAQRPSAISFAVLAVPGVMAERTARELQDERDRLLTVGQLRLAAELTTWIDELLAEEGRARLARSS
jgi:hypothetical protein